MFIKHLSILNYRNIAAAELSLAPKINCFIGSNGQGKTNILDAIYFLSLTKSMFTSIDSMNVRHGEGMFMLKGEYDLNGVDEQISCGLKIGQKKHIKRNQKEYKRMTEHIGLLPLIIVSPADIMLITSGSDERRRFMDVVISQYDSQYLSSLQSYNKALMQRNAMLKAETEPNPEMMAIMEEMMATYGEYIYTRRTEFVNEFIPVFQSYYTRIANTNEEVHLEYTSHGQRGRLLDVIRADRQKDRIVGYSLHGVHKDDLVMTLNGYSIKREGSQGQNKTYLISMKLAQFEFLKRTGSCTTPLLLLDDIFDKLDSQRVSNIIQLVSENTFGQIFITDTNRENIDRLVSTADGTHRIFNVENGTVTTNTPGIQL